MKMRPFLYGVLLAAVAAPAAGQGFGRAVAVHSADVLVGEPQTGLTPGVVYVFRRGQGGAYAEATRLRAANAAPNDGFGAAIAVQGDWALISATNQNDGRGAAYLMRRDNRGRWTDAGILTATDAAEGDGFGSAVALGDGIAFVAAAQQDSGAGAVYVFRMEGNRWVQSAKLYPSDRQPGDRFGTVMVAASDQLIVSAPFRESRKGIVYVFARNAEGAWQQQASLEPAGAERDARIGTSLLVLGGRVLVGAPGVERLAGAVYVFGRSDQGDWREQMALRPFDLQRNLQFGLALAASGDDILIGAPGAARFQGRLYRYRWDAAAETFTSAVHVVGMELPASGAFGASVAAGGNLAVSGTPNDDNGAGTAVVLERTNNEWRTVAKVAGALNAVEPMVGQVRECQDGQVGIFACDGVDMLAFLPLASIGGSRGIRMNDIWGWTDPETGQEWAIAGRTDGSAFVDVTDPQRPRYAGSLPMTQGARANAWRDMKVYRNHVYIVADGSGQHGMQVFDLTQLRRATGAPQTFRETALYTNVASTHNIVIDTTSGFAFAVGVNGGGETCGGGLHMIDIREPANPRFAGCFADPNTGRSGTGYSHDAQCVTYQGPDDRYRGHEICFGANETALSIADVSDKQNPVALSRASYPNVGYTHQGWLTDDQRYFYMDDELDELQGKTDGTRTLIWDVEDLQDPVLLGAYVSENKASDHNLYIQGDLMFQSNYQSGLRVLDISDRANPRPVGHFDTVPYGSDSPGFGGSWSNYPYFASGTIVVTSGSEGLFILRKQSPALVP
ncbi:MAG: choice-of-anchor B family protein [Gemmatimonadales bacterium]